jgi:hypothetical protein
MIFNDTIVDLAADAPPGLFPAREQMAHLAVRVMPRSGTPTELLAAAAIDAASIERAGRRLLDGTNGPSPGYDAPASTSHHCPVAQP